VDVLVLGEYGSLVQERRELLKKFVALILRHQRQAERRYHCVYSLDAPLAEFRVEVFNTRMDQDRSRVGNGSLEAVEEGAIDFKNQQGGARWQLVEQRASDRARAGPQFQRNAGSRQGEWLQHGCGEVF
jgi:hypothetical protein